MIEQAVLDLLARLGEEKRGQALLPFEGGARFDWHCIPRERPGLQFGAMSEGERQARWRCCAPP